MRRGDRSGITAIVARDTVACDVAALKHDERIYRHVEMAIARVNCRFGSPVVAKY